MDRLNGMIPIPQIQTKVIFIDWVDFSRRAIFASRVNGNQWLKYTCLKMIFSCLKKIEITSNDFLVIACNDGGNGNSKLDEILSVLETTTPFFTLRVDKVNSKDIISYGVRYFTDNECIIISCDSMLEQLLAYPNVKILSSKTKKFKIVKNPSMKIVKQVHKEGLNNLGSKDLNFINYKKELDRLDITKLSEDKEIAIDLRLKEMEVGKSYSSMDFPFYSLREEVTSIYDNSKKKVTSYSESLKKKRKKLTLTAHNEPLF